VLPRERRSVPRRRGKEMEKVSFASCFDSPSSPSLLRFSPFFCFLDGDEDFASENDARAVVLDGGQDPISSRTRKVRRLPPKAPRASVLRQNPRQGRALSKHASAKSFFRRHQLPSSSSNGSSLSTRPLDPPLAFSPSSISLGSSSSMQSCPRYGSALSRACESFRKGAKRTRFSPFVAALDDARQLRPPLLRLRFLISCSCSLLFSSLLALTSPSCLS